MVQPDDEGRFRLGMNVPTDGAKQRLRRPVGKDEKVQ